MPPNGLLTDPCPPRIDVVSLFPGMLAASLGESIVGRASRRGLVGLHYHDPRAWAAGRHKNADDRPYGGGPGMVMSAEVLGGCIDHCLCQSAKPRLLLTSPQGRRLDQPWLRELATAPHLVIVCGHYEGIDERIVQHYRPELFSLGDFVLSGGEIPALALIDGLVRLLPGALGHAESAVAESFTGAELDHPCYTRPPVWRGLAVPAVLQSGDHAAIERWRADERARRTKERQGG